MLKNLHEETKILKKIDHPNVIKVYETYKTREHFYVVIEYSNCGDLESLL